MPLRHTTLQQLRIFAAVAKHLSMARAAEELHLTPAALSIQVKQLSEAVGRPLLEQIGKKLFLTAAGERVLAASRDVFGRLDLLAHELAEDDGLTRGSLRLSIITTAKYFVPRLLGVFCQRHPGIEVELEVGNRDSLLERLRQNLDDLYIMGRPPANLAVSTQPFMENPLVVIAPAGHPLANERDIEPARLAGELFILREAGSGTRLAMERFFEAHGVRLAARMVLGSNEAVKQAVAGGLGVAVLSRHTLTLDRASGAFAILDVKGFPLKKEWLAVTPKGKQLSAVARAFLDFIAAEGGLPDPGLGAVDRSQRPGGGAEP